MPDIPFTSAQRSPASQQERAPADWSGIDPARAESAKKFAMSPDMLRKMDAIPAPPDTLNYVPGGDRQVTLPPDGSTGKLKIAPAAPADNKANDLYAPLSEDEKQAVDPMYAPVTDEEKKQLDAEDNPPSPDLSAMKDHVVQALSGFFAKKPPAVAGESPQPAAPDAQKAAAHPAGSIMEAIESGLQISTSGLALRGKLPDTVLPEDAPRVYKIAASLSQVAGDLPAMLAGGAAGLVGGTVAGAAIGAPTGPGDLGFAAAGGAVGTYAGANALPAALRKIMMDHYEKGDIKDKQDFWDRLTSTTIETLKAGTVGAATGAAGKVAGAMAEPLAGPLTTAAAKTMSEIATMVGVGKGLEGQMPNADDFLVAAATVGAFHGVETATAPIAAKMRSIYAKTGVLPHEVAEEAANNPAVKSELLASNIEIPAAYKAMEEAPEKTAEPPKPAEPGTEQKTVSGFIDTRGQGRQFHGTSNEIGGLYEGAYNDRNIYGQGLYTTDAMDIANGYSKKGGGQNRTIYEVKPNRDVKLYDMEKPIPPEVTTELQRIGAQFSSSDVVNNALADKPKNLREFYDAVRDYSKSEDISTNDVQEAVFYPIQDALQKLGYGGLEHKGGLLTKNPEHNVQIYFNPHTDVSIEKVNPDDFRPAKTLDPHPNLTEPSNVLNPDQQEQVSSNIRALRGLRILGESGRLGNAEEPQRSEAAQKILSKIVQRPKGEGYSFQKFYADWVDRLNPLAKWEEQLTGGKAAQTGDSPYLIARNVPGTSNKVQYFLERAPFDFNTYADKGKPFNQIIEPFKKDPDMLDAALVAKRTVELAKQGKTKLPVDLETAQQFLKEQGGKFDQAAKELTDFQNKALAYLRDSGVLSADAYKAITEMHKDYVPLYRLMDEGESSGAKGAGKGMSVRNPLKSMSEEGSDRAVIRPLESVVKNAEAYITLAERNRVGVAMAELAEKNPDVAKGLFVRQKTQMRAIEVQAPEVQRMLNAHGVALEGELPEAFSIFRPQNFNISDNELAVFRKGKREVYEVPAEVGKALKGMDVPSASLFMKLMQLPARVLRAGTVLSPSFSLRHFFRNQFTAYANTEGNGVTSGYTPFFSAIHAVKDIVGKSEAFGNWTKAGGAFGAADKLDDYVNRDIYGLSKKTGMIGQAFNVLKTPLDLITLLHNVTEFADRTGRVGVFKANTKENATPEQMRKAAYTARESSVDMNRAGLQARAINQAIAFWNIGGVQGTDRLVRSIKENPIGFSAKAIAGITLPSVLLWMASHTDDKTKGRYDNIPDWEKNTYWHWISHDWKPATEQEAGLMPSYMKRQAADGSWEVDHGITHKAPKPFIEGVLFGTSVERVLDAYYDHNPKAMGELAKAILLDHTPGITPTAVSPVIEQFANKSLFTGGAIIPHNLEGIAPQYQYTEYTTDTAKALGKMIAAVPGVGKTSFASPMVLENYARGWGGAMGTYALQLSDQFLHAGSDALSKAQGKPVGYPTPNKPALDVADIPFVKDFVTRGLGGNAQSIQDFYEKLDEAERYQKTVHHLAQIGDLEAAQKEMALEENQEQFGGLQGVAKGLSNQAAMIHNINRDPSMPPGQKRQLIQGLYGMMIDAATNANTMADQYAKAVREAHK